MANTDQEVSEGKSVGEGAAGENTVPAYHAPVLTAYGALAELVQVNPGSGSDGGTLDCQHN